MADDKETRDAQAKTNDDASLTETDLDDVSGGALNAYIGIKGQSQGQPQSS